MLEVKQINLSGEDIKLNDEIARDKINGLEKKIDNIELTNFEYDSDNETILVENYNV